MALPSAERLSINRNSAASASRMPSSRCCASASPVPRRTCSSSRAPAVSRLRRPLASIVTGPRAGRAALACAYSPLAVASTQSPASDTRSPALLSVRSARGGGSGAFMGYRLAKRRDPAP